MRSNLGIFSFPVAAIIALDGGKHSELRQPISRQHSVHVSRCLPVRPRIVSSDKAHPLRPRGVVEHPKLDERARIWVGQVDLPAFFEVVRGDLRLVGHNAVDYLQAEAIRFVLKIAADRVECWRGEKGQDSKNQEQNRQGSPVLNTANAPQLPPACQRPVRQSIPR